MRITASLPSPDKNKVSELSKGLKMTESPCSHFQQAPTFASVGICIKPWIKGLLFMHKGAAGRFWFLDGVSQELLSYRTVCVCVSQRPPSYRTGVS